MTFYINGKFLQDENLAGVGRYGVEVIPRLLACFPKAQILAPKNIPKKWKETFPLVQFGRFRGAAWEQFDLPLFLRGKKEKLLNVANTAPLSYQHNFTVVHDIISLTNPEWYSLKARLYFRMLQPGSIRNSKHLFTVSHFSKREILRHFQLPSNHITVTPSAAGDFWRVDRSQKNQEGRYLLAVSSLDPRKNFSSLIKAFLKLKDNDLKLIIVGGSDKTFPQLKLPIPSEKAHLVKFTGFLPDEQLRHLYSHALAFVFPSLKEGFGAPAIEAMQCGCPVIASDIPVLHEICAEAALFADPYSIPSLREQIERLINDSALCSQLQQKGFKRAADFSWDLTAQEVSKRL